MQLLVRVVSKINDKDPVLDSKLTKAGDVICYKPDGVEWGIAELKNPDWRIISAPGMTEEQAIALTSPEQPPTLDRQYPLLRRRQMKLDLTQLDQLAGGKITADQTATVAEIDKLQQDVTQGTKTDADLKSYIQTKAIDATVQAADLMSIAALKPAIDAAPVEDVPADTLNP